MRKFSQSLGRRVQPCTRVRQRSEIQQRLGHFAEPVVAQPINPALDGLRQLAKPAAQKPSHQLRLSSVETFDDSFSLPTGGQLHNSLLIGGLQYLSLASELLFLIGIQPKIGVYEARDQVHFS